MRGIQVEGVAPDDGLLSFCATVRPWKYGIIYCETCDMVYIRYGAQDGKEECCKDCIEVGKDLGYIE